LERKRRECQLDAPNPTNRIVFPNESDQLLTRRDSQFLTRERGSLHALEELVNTDLLEQEASAIQNILAFTNQVVLDWQELVGESAAVTIARGEDCKLTLTIQDEKLAELRHMNFL
jgi:hypothetical protein